MLCSLAYINKWGRTTENHLDCYIDVYSSKFNGYCMQTDTGQMSKKADRCDV